jgi:creatinine amidohydrolase/Fe(II)-dependent formamide hydrolase-like protein
MVYGLMFPDEHEAAKKSGMPLVIPVGNIEYHGPHTVCGTDIIITEGIAELLEKETEMVLAPSFAYAPSSYAASGPEKGTVHTDMDVFERFIKGILRAFLEGGWENIYILIHHQYDMELLFPLTLSCLKAAKQLFFDMMEEDHGRGWFARAGDLGGVIAKMNTVKVLPVMSREVQQKMGYDHAGKVECSLVAALKPDMELVKPELAKGAEWFAAEAPDYSAAYGREIIAQVLQDLKEKIK